MSLVDVNDYKEQKDCTYKGERYSVRDNGAVYRHKRKGKRKRPNDNEWTFGKENNSNPYLLHSGVRVHRIVATAFHGKPDDPKYVVDHIDTNCRNNRPENLRWLSRLENALKNDATRKKIEYHCGSIEAFLENPSMLHNLELETNIDWMRTVTPEEAENTLIRMSIWANTENSNSRSTNVKGDRDSFNKRVLQPIQKWEAGLAGEPGLDFASTPWCGQYMWGKDIYFPLCPQFEGAPSLEDYYQNLKEGSVFAYKEDNEFPKFTVYKSEILPSNSSILVMCKRSDGCWAITGIQQNEKQFLIHHYYGSYVNKADAEKVYSTKREDGNPWQGNYIESWDPR